MQEFLVIFACLNSTGCSETSNTYYHYHPEVRKIVQRHEERAKEIAGPVIVKYSAPFFFLAAGGTGNFKIYGDFSLQMKEYTTPTLVYSKGF
jgi:hypothetical protein